MRSETDIVIACCRDEADLISAFIDFYVEQGFDWVCLVDNGSQDRTTFQIDQHPFRDRTLLFRDPRLGYDKRLLDYYSMFAEHASRWVFFVDVDEFVLIPGGIKAYAHELSPKVTVLRLPVAEMLPEMDAWPPRHPLLTGRREAKFQSEEKVVWKKSNVSKIYCGKHEVEVDPYVSHRDPRVFIRHYHTRSKRQFRRKLINRIETDSAISSIETARLSLFSQRRREEWVEKSHYSLKPGGWEMERRRLESVNWIHDDAVAAWFAGQRSGAESLRLSPVISIPIGKRVWQSFCVRELQVSEGHTGDEHLVLVLTAGKRSSRLSRKLFAGRRDVPVRIHSECLFSDVFGTSRCDCGRQLAAAMRRIEEVGFGVIIYLRQEGRGIGLFDKVRSLAVQEGDSYARNEALGLDGDCRGYRLGARILRGLGVRSVSLMTGNPAKVGALRAAGIKATVYNGTCPSDLSPEAAAEIAAKLKRGFIYGPECLHTERCDRSKRTAQ